MKTIYIDSKGIKALKENVEDDTMQIGFEPGGFGYGHVIEDVEEDVSPEDVDLSSFKLKDRLNPRFWKDGLLDSRIRLQLLDIADDFIDFLGVTWVDYDDILMTGSLANYNWSERFSDIDLHIVMNYDKIDERKDMVERFLKAQTMLWNGEHEELSICGYPVEVYVQDSEEKPRSGGIYSLDKNKWLKKPEKDDLDDSSINKRWVQRRAASYMDDIEHLEERYEKAGTDDFKLERIGNSVEKLFDKIKKDRKDGFEKGGDEMNDKNIVFKTLRREGYLQKLSDLRKNVYNRLKSI